MINVLRVINVLWLLVAIALTLIYWTFEVVIIHELTRLIFSAQKYRKSIKAGRFGS
ncbi:hypothetical protein [Clostridium sp. FP1]|uniref:hypothetical protein n=1 Tax=Clostridium sp. FP1 TaxID=2724076 RepID=UPI0013E97F4A|nr:hypothetical protein [Clostridium sp. FP1]MBZ9637625.1 hypothetical protein [Clostridium sp. FP1]